MNTCYLLFIYHYQFLNLFFFLNNYIILALCFTETTVRHAAITEKKVKSSIREIFKIQKQCEESLSHSLPSMKTLPKLICRQALKAIAILPVPLQYRAFKHNQIHGILSKDFLGEKVAL